MIESFVDLTYRGLSLARRVRLTQVRPTTGYLEMSTPMPIGTSIRIVTDDGLELEATVTAIHEQVGGSDRPPGMMVTPRLGSDAELAAQWWSHRVALPDAQAPAPPRAGPVTVRPRSHTVPTTPVSEVSVVVSAPERSPEPGRTEVMETPDPEAAAPDTAVMDAVVLPDPAGDDAVGAVVDDDDKQMVATSTPDASASVSMPSLGGDSRPDGPPRDQRPAGGGYSKKRRKKR